MANMLRIAARIAVGSVFLAAGIVKVDKPLQLSETIMNYHLVTVDLALVIAAILPTLEIIVGACLILKFFRRAALVLAATLSLLFSVALASLLVRGIDINCGCFSAAQGALTMPLVALAKNMVLLGLIVFAYQERKIMKRGQAHEGAEHRSLA